MIGNFCDMEGKKLFSSFNASTLRVFYKVFTLSLMQNVVASDNEILNAI